MGMTGKLWGTLAVSVAACFLWPTQVRAQQDPPPPPPKDEQPKPAATSTPLVLNGDSPQDPDVGSAPAGPPNPYAGTIKDLGTGLPLVGSSSTPLRWGSFSIYTFEAMGLYDNFLPLGSSTSTTTDLGIFRFGVMFDHYVLRHKSRIVLQYLPQLVVGDGGVYASGTSNNNVSLGTRFQLTPRLSLTVGDNFIQIHDNSLVPQNYLAVNNQIGALAQNYFLNANGNFLTNSADATIEYDLSPRTNITFSPSFKYMQSINPLTTYSADGYAYMASVALGHAFTPHRTVGLTGSYQYLNETIGSIPQNATYYTAAAYYSEQLASTLWVTATLGATDQHYAALPQPGGWGVSAGASLNKAFSRSVTLALDYTRGTAFTNYVTRQRADRVDGSLGIRLSSRIVWKTDVGYYSELGGTNPTRGKYGTTGLVYRFFGNFSLFTTFAYTNQDPGTLQLLSGDEKTLVYGVRWSPPWLSSK
jgi:hypothetical protein